MEEILIKNIGKIKKLKNRLEKALGSKISISADKVMIESETDAFSEYIGARILEALDFGFDFDSAIQLKSEEFMIEKVKLKDYVRQSRLRAVKGRIIGKKGKAIKVLSLLSDCAMQISGYDIWMIGETDDVDVCLAALQKLIRGAPHPKVYAFLERSRALKRINDSLVH